MCAPTHSKPDVVPLSLYLCLYLTRCLHSRSSAERSQHSVILLLDSFTHETSLYRRAVGKYVQHSILRQVLLQNGWGTVTFLPFIIGHACSIPASFSTALP